MEKFLVCSRKLSPDPTEDYQKPLWNPAWLKRYSYDSVYLGLYGKVLVSVQVPLIYSAGSKLQKYWAYSIYYEMTSYSKKIFVSSSVNTLSVRGVFMPVIAYQKTNSSELLLPLFLHVTHNFIQNRGCSKLLQLKFYSISHRFRNMVVIFHI